ncbi:MAG: MFS transporter, partial [Acidimicrobiales bacterium]
MARGHAVKAGRARPGLGRGFALLLSASAVSTVGNGLATAAFPLLATRLTSDPFLVSVVTAAGTMPWLVFGLLSGVVVDRTDRRRLMWRTDAARAVLVGGLVLALVTVGIGIWTLALFAAAVGVG